VNKATQGLCNYLKSQEKLISIAIGYDSRINSEQLARSAAEVVAGCGAIAYVFTELIPNQLMSYMVLEFGCNAGIVITESDSPNEYNEYKVYGSDGFVIALQVAESIQNFVNQVDMFNDVKIKPFTRALKEDAISFISQNLVDRYLDQVEARMRIPVGLKDSDVNAIRNTRNETRNKPVREIFSRFGLQRGRHSHKTLIQSIKS